ncbi:hypothetical protein TNCV_3721351 [Trichonephila clavipes]|nr:hypothetical protein TNCV_3721351 [Trichonephila clavipes]
MVADRCWQQRITERILSIVIEDQGFPGTQMRGRSFNHNIGLILPNSVSRIGLTPFTTFLGIKGRETGLQDGY